MILEFRPHRGKMRIPVPGQKVHVSVKDRPDGRDVDSEVDEIPESVRQHCDNCDQGEKGLFIVSLSFFLMETLVGLNNFEEINHSGTL
jgi:hypothetical protein